MECENTCVNSEAACLKDTAQNIGKRFSKRQQAMGQVILPLKEAKLSNSSNHLTNYVSPKSAIDFQKNAMETGEMYYYELDYQKVAKQIL